MPCCFVLLQISIYRCFCSESDLFTIIDDKLLDTNNFDCYYVQVELDALTPGEDFSNGEITTVNENGE